MRKEFFSKQQLQTIMILTAVIFLLLCGVAYTVSTRPVTPVSGKPADERPPHVLQRDARVSANEHIAWETNLGGSADEQPVAVLCKNNEIYIFGNTCSNDLDFAGESEGKLRGFGARLTAGGRTVEYTLYDFTVQKAIPTLSGFAVAGNEGSSAGLYVLSDTLTVTGKTVMSPTHALSAVGLYVFDNRYFLIAESYDTLSDTKSLLLHVYTTGLTLEIEKVFSHTYSLDFLDLMPYDGGYILAASASFQGLGYLTVARFSLLNVPAYTDYKLGHAYTPTSFVPLGSGFAAICDYEGKCELLLLNSSFVKTDLKFFTEVANSNQKLLFYAGTAIYAYTGEALLRLGDDGRTVGTVNFAPERIVAFCSNGVAAFIAGATQDGITLARIGTQTDTFSLQVTSTARAALYCDGTSLLLAADCSGKTQDCTDNFGGSDVWLCKLPLV